MRWRTLIGPASRRFRLKRAQRILELFPDIASMEVLDLGGSLHFWESVGEILKPRSLTIMNIAHDPASVGWTDKSAWSRVELYDGQHIPRGDKAVDLLICNSVIEHVPLGNREGLAREIERVAKNWVVQTPAFEFPVEVHFLAPFLHWMPRALARQLARITPFALTARGARPVEFFDEIHLLTHRAFQRLFPTATIEAERFAGMPKSYLAYSHAT